MNDPLITYLQELTAHASERGTSNIDYAAHASTVRIAARPAEYLSVGSFAERIGRNKTTLLSWIQRGQHDIPQPLGRTSNGYIWDGADVDAWALAHQGVCHKAATDPFAVPPPVLAPRSDSAPADFDG